MTCSGVEHFGEDIYKRNQSYHCRFERVTGKNSKINQYLEAQSLDGFGWWLCSRWLSDTSGFPTSMLICNFQKTTSFFSASRFSKCVLLFENFSCNFVMKSFRRWQKIAFLGLFHPVFSFRLASFNFLFHKIFS